MIEDSERHPQVMAVYEALGDRVPSAVLDEAVNYFRGRIRSPEKEIKEPEALDHPAFGSEDSGLGDYPLKVLRAAVEVDERRENRSDLEVVSAMTEPLTPEMDSTCAVNVGRDHGEQRVGVVSDTSLSVHPDFEEVTLFEERKPRPKKGPRQTEEDIARDAIIAFLV